MFQNEYLINVFKATPLPGLLLLADAPRFTIVAANVAYLEVTGLAECYLLRKGIFEAFPENENGLQGKLRASLYTALETGKAHQMAVQRYDLPRQEGGETEARYWSPENTPVLVDQQAVFLIHTVEDVSTEVRLEAELRERGRRVPEKFEDLVQTVDGIFWEADAQTFEVTYISPQIERILGFSTESWKGNPGFWHRQIHPDDRERTFTFCRQMIKAAADFRAEYRMIASDGSIVWFQDIVSVISVDNRPRFLKGLMVDITAGKRAEEVIKASEKRYQLLFNTSPLAKWVYDLDSFRILDVNETAVLRYGYSREEFLEMSINGLNCSEDSPGLFEAVFYANKHAQMFSRGVHRHVKKSGEIIHVELQKNIIDFNGSKAALILSTDITDRVMSITAIEEQNQKLSEIAFLQSHVAREPLARIMGIINLIEETDRHSEEFTELLDYLSKSGQELDQILKNIVAKTNPHVLT